MSALWIMLGLMFGHWFGDFVCQTNWMAQNKSKNWLALATHVVSYSLVMTITMAIILSFGNWAMVPPNAGMVFIFFGLVAVPHFVVDAVTSRISGYWWKNGKLKEFFITIGFDQFLHFACLTAAVAALWRI